MRHLMASDILEEEEGTGGWERLIVLEWSNTFQIKKKGINILLTVRQITSVQNTTMICQKAIYNCVTPGLSLCSPSLKTLANPHIFVLIWKLF